MEVPITTAPLAPGATISHASVSAYNTSSTTFTPVPWSGTAEITTQTLKVEIYRQPVFNLPDYNLTSVSLSATPTDFVSHRGSKLRMKVNVTVDRQIQSGVFNGSSVFTPQKFQVIRESVDTHGNAYDTTGSVEGTVGPQCRVISNIGVRRVPWDGSSSPFTESITNAYDFSDVSSLAASYSNSRFWGDWSLNNDCLNAPRPRVDSNWNWMGGKYDPDNELADDMKDLIHAIGLHVKTTGFWDGNVPASLDYAPSYDRNWHDYSS